MPKQFIHIVQAQQNFADAFACLIGHRDCPPNVYDHLSRFAEDMENSFSETISPTKEARRIRKELPKWLTGGTWEVADE